MAQVWRRCSTCKRDIECGATYWACNVSTCNRKRTGLVFCTTECWDAHLGYVNHRESWAEERTAPARPQPDEASSERREPRRRAVASAPAARPVSASTEVPREILVIASKLKAYIKARSGMNTSDRLMEVLSDEVRQLADRAIERARRAERKTVLDRDLEPGSGRR
jgi:histone H3/H4